ncbi:hypothetical protein LMG26842_05392 [Achromobacter dolens]|nr:hypothetical protein LMG26842_05392 [Achromobacter dolens]
MTVPTRAELTEALFALTRRLDAVLVQHENRVIRLATSREAALEAIGRLLDFAGFQLERALELPALQWLCTDRGMRASWHSVRRTVQFSEREGSLHVLGVRLIPNTPDCIMDFDVLGSMERWENHLQDEFRHIGAFRQWSFMTLHAVREYLYHDSAVDDITATWKNLEHLERQCFAGIDAMRQIYQAADSTHMVRRVWRDSPEAETSRLTQRIIEVLASTRRHLPPIRRRDATAKIRLLMYRLWMCNKSLFGRPKLAGLQHILASPDLDIFIDQRTVERTCATFKGPANSMKGSLYYRRLTEEFNDESAGAQSKEISLPKDRGGSLAAASK